jgi:hypothetical protein
LLDFHAHNNNPPVHRKTRHWRHLKGMLTLLYPDAAMIEILTGLQ